MRYIALLVILVLCLLALGPLMLEWGKTLRNKIKELWKE